MKAKLNCILRLFLLVILISPHALAQKETDDICKITDYVIANLKKEHISPPSFDENGYREVVELLLNDIDPNRQFFLETDKKMLAGGIVNEKNNGVCKIISDVTEVFKKRMVYTDSIFAKTIRESEKLKTNDSIEFIGKNSIKKFAAGEKELALRIERRTKFNFLLMQYDLENDTLIKKREVAEAQKLLKRQYELSKPRAKSDDGLQRFVAEKFWNALALRCDPHSNYFNIDTKNEFEKSISTTEFSFGIITSENENGEIEIVNIIPGSAAWKSNKLNEGDIITRAAFNKLKEAEINHSSSEEFNSKLKSQSHKELTLEVRKKNGNVAETTITKTKINSTENTCDGYILEGIHNKFGYISLPAFYTDYENYEGLGCANDVAKEILKLKKENIEGLILDLRNNGGGSLTEALDLAGLFINEGPLGIFKLTNDKPRVIKDMNRGTVYDGPLLILVNQLSASASEFLAATLQDYNRAVIAGQSTYGKATGQSIMPVDTNNKSGNYNAKSMGFLKLTNLKLYRVNGFTHQGTGVTPDLNIPDILMLSGFYKESKELFYIGPDSANKKAAYQPFSPIPLNELRQRSKDRVLKSKIFNSIEGSAQKIANSLDNGKKFPISKNGVEQYLFWSEKFSSEIENSSNYHCLAFKASNNNYLSELITKTPELLLDNKLVLENLQKDPILEESFLILKDYCSLTLKK